MKLVLAATLVVIAGLGGGTVTYVYRQATLAHDRAVDHCLDAGGAWLPRSSWSFAGTCLAHPAEDRATPPPKLIR